MSIFADGLVVASANNEAYTTQIVASGAVTLDRPHAVIHVGLPITADLETLNIDNASGETLADKKQLISRATIFVETSRGIWVGPMPPEDDTLNDDEDPLYGLREAKVRNAEGYDSPVDLKTDTVQVNFENAWNSHGRIFIRQVDPLPLAVLTVIPAGFTFQGGA